MYYMLMLVLVGCAVPVNGHTLHSTDSVLVVQASRCTACLRCAVPKQGVVWWESKLEKELRWKRSCRSCAESALAANVPPEQARCQRAFDASPMPLPGPPPLCLAGRGRPAPAGAAVPSRDACVCCARVVFQNRALAGSRPFLLPGANTPLPVARVPRAPAPGVSPGSTCV